MNYKENLYTVLAEECAEIAKCSTKILRFGEGDFNPLDGKNNLDTFNAEVVDLLAMIEMVTGKSIMQIAAENAMGMELKKRKVNHFYEKCTKKETKDEQLPCGHYG